MRSTKNSTKDEAPRDESNVHLDTINEDEDVLPEVTGPRKLQGAEQMPTSYTVWFMELDVALISIIR